MSEIEPGIEYDGNSSGNPKTTIKINGKVVNEHDGSGASFPRKSSSALRRGHRPDVGYIGSQNHDENSTV